MTQFPATKLAAIIDQYALLVRNGNHFVGHCPACHSIPPRMIVRPELAEWHCFHCGTGGDVIDFLRIVEQLDQAGAKVRLKQLLEAGNHAEPRPEPAAPAVAPANDSERAAFEGLLDRLANIKGFEGGMVLVGRLELTRGRRHESSGQALQLLAIMLTDSYQVLGEPGEPFGVVTLHNEQGKLMLVEGELRGHTYSVLLLLAAEVNEAMFQLMLRSYLSRLA